MFKTFLGTVVTLLCSSTAGICASVCDSVLNEQVINTEKKTTNAHFAFSKRDDICRATYNSVQDAQSAAQQAGFNIGYGGLSIGADKATTTASGHYEISNTNFCRATAEDFSSAYGTDYESRVGSIAVSAWRDCVGLVAGNRIFIEIAENDNGAYFTGTLYHTASSGTLNANITAINAVGDGKSDLKCTIGGVEYSPGILTEPYIIDTTKTAISCEKPENKSVSVAFQTNVDSVPFIQMPSKQGIQEVKLTSLQAMVQQALSNQSQFVKLPIGTIVSSMLTEAQFTAANGTDWVLADGRSVPGTSYANSISANVPDLRGVFLRGANLGRKGELGDPSGDRALGSYQADMIKFHQHEINRSQNGGGEDNYVGASGQRQQNTGWPRAKTNFMDVDGKAVDERQASETRPRNVAVNFYIRVQ